MSLSAEYCDDKTGNRDGAAMAQQRRLICGLIIWSTLLTLGLAASIVFQFIPGASLVPDKPKNHSNVIQHPVLIKQTEDNLMTFQPHGGHMKMQELNWTTYSPGFISGQTQLTVNKDGLYFIYLQVTLEKEGESCTVTVKGNNNEPILSSQINKSQKSTGLMAKGVALNKGDSFTVTCDPKASIKTSQTETYLGVIKIG